LFGPFRRNAIAEDDDAAQQRRSPMADKNGNGIRSFNTDLAMDRDHTTRLAHQLSVAALRQTEKAFGGLLAVPVAAALGLASSVMFIAAFFERGFEIFESSIAEIGDNVRPVSAIRETGYEARS
jgi:hypothetical protein